MKSENQNSHTSKEVTGELIEKYLESFDTGEPLSKKEIEQFIQIATVYQLNPFKREVHCVAYGKGSYRRLNIIVGYEVYLKRAERTGKLDGWSARIDGEGESMKALVEIHRKDWDHPFTHEVYWLEAVQKKNDGTITSFWKKMPKFQLKKVAISQAFRMCFPDELGGIPYDSAELPQEEESQRPEPSKPKTAKKKVSKEPMKSMPFEDYAAQKELEDSKVIPFSSIPTITDAHRELAGRLNRHKEVFTESHLQWVIDKVQADPSEEKAKTMLNYVQKIIDQNPKQKKAQ